MTVEMSLTKGATTVVDDEDHVPLSVHKWHLSSAGYAARRDYTSQKIVLMHREILGVEGRQRQVDHINMDRLDNRRENLRIVSNRENNINRGIPSNNTSGYKGVSFCKEKRLWAAYITDRGVRHFLGRFQHKSDAARAYNDASLIYHGEYAQLNNIVEECPNDTTCEIAS